MAWLLAGLVVDVATWWTDALEIASSAVTLVMVFAIQHTQGRQQSATHRNLDELPQTMPTPEDRLIAVEEAPDGELEALADLNLADSAGESSDEDEPTDLPGRRTCCAREPPPRDRPSRPRQRQRRGSGGRVGGEVGGSARDGGRPAGR